MKNIYIFNIGNVSEQLSKNIALLKKMNYNVIIGPSQEENDYLINNYPYYKVSLDEKLWAFASDVWRCYILANNKGLYIDTSLIVGNNFDSFFNKVSQYDAWIPKTSDLYTNVPVLYSNKSKIFEMMLDFYKTFDQSKSIRDFPFAPRILTILCINNKLITKGVWEEHIVNFNNEKICFGTVLDIRDKSTVFKYGSGSWFKKRLFSKYGAKRGWDRFERLYKKRSYKYMKQPRWLEIQKYLDISK